MLVAESWREDIPEVIQGARMRNHADVNIIGATTGGTLGLEGTVEVKTTLTTAEWNKASKGLLNLLYLIVGKYGELLPV